MHFDRWEGNRFDHVVKGDARKSVAGRIDDGPVDIIDVRLKCINQYAFVIGLLDDDFNAKFISHRMDFFINELERFRPVNFGFTAPKEVRIRAIQDEESKPSTAVAGSS